MFKIRRGDTVYVIRGEDTAKKGKVLQVLPREKRAIVEGVNLVKKHKRRTREDQQTGIVEVESPISISNLAFFCKHCNKPSRVGFTVLKDGAKTRFCKRCKEVF